jgi:galactokinase
VGAEILFDSTIPLGGGLSSSAALEVATALAMLRAAGGAAAIPPRELALLCQKAEHEFAGAPVGIMDQSICIMGQAGRALLLDCRTGQTRQVPFDDPALVLLVCDTRVKHELNDGGYGARRAQCESAARKLGVHALRDASSAQADACADLTQVERMRVRHVIGEIARTTQAVVALESADYAEFGRLMVASHISLRDDYQVSCEELDAIVDLACASAGVFGARMTGGGFGGCAIVLVRADHADAVSRTIADGFSHRFSHPCPIFATHAAAGASVL